MKFGSLFAGIGGFDLGLERAGMSCAWQVEIDPFCQKILAKHWPHVPKFGDIRNVKKETLEPVDLICGGFPCQPHSLAGKRKGSADDRDLWPEYRRLIDELRPRWVIGENVPGIRTTILDQVLSDLENLNYSTGALIIPACAFDAPHRRERVFVLAHSIGERCGGRGNGDEAGNDGPVQIERPRSRDEQGILADAERTGLEVGNWIRKQSRQTRSSAFVGSWWKVEPPVGRVVDGVPGRVDRIRSLGNAVVPQVVEFIGRYIVEVENRFALSAHQRAHKGGK
jgi:DNA (cytosine-5)-methyltransferase 1